MTQQGPGLSMAGASVGGGGGTAVPPLSRRAGLCHHPGQCRGRGVLSSACATGSWVLPRLVPRQLHESLQGRPEVSPLPTPRRYRMPPLPAPSGFTDVSPVFIPPLRVKATLVDRTRVRKPYATGSTCVSTPIDLTSCYPAGGENMEPAQERFSSSGPQHTGSAIL